MGKIQIMIDISPSYCLFLEKHTLKILPEKQKKWSKLFHF